MPEARLSARGEAIAAVIQAAGIAGDPLEADHGGSPILKVPPEQLLAIARSLASDLGYSYLSCLTALDWPDRWEVVYHLHDFQRNGTLVVKTSTPKDEDTLPSVTSIWPAANWYEREAFDMFGIRFEGHPNLCRILMADDWQTFPMRKDQPMDVEGGY